jgi:hypothetical protein
VIDIDLSADVLINVGLKVDLTIFDLVKRATKCRTSTRRCVAVGRLNSPNRG